MNITNITHVALRPPKSVPALIGFAKHIVQAMTNNAYFPSPPVALATVTSQIVDLDAAETVVKGRTKGAADTRNLKLKAVVTSLRTLETYVQSVVAADETQGSAIVQAAGMNERRKTSRQKPALAASMAGAPGLVALHAKAAGKRAAYEWQYSGDGSKTWTPIALTTLASVTVPNLTAGTAYLFRVRSTIGHVTGDWSQVISFLVH
jgi:hypothetical protein